MVATEDRYAPKQYFAAFRMPRVSVEVAETSDGRSAARHVVARLKAIYEEAKRNNEVQENDQFWVLLDTDHWTQPNHVAAFTLALKEARDSNFKVAVSNPCFEVWLLLHVAEVVTPLPACSVVEDQLRVALGGYSKQNVPAERLLQGVDVAIERARRLDPGANGWPQDVGTQHHQLVEAIRAAG